MIPCKQCQSLESCKAHGCYIECAKAVSASSRRLFSPVDQLLDRTARAAAAEHATVEAMEAFGGSFVKALAAAYVKGDEINRAKIRETWPDYWQEYSDIAARRAKA